MLSSYLPRPDWRTRLQSIFFPFSAISVCLCLPSCTCAAVLQPCSQSSLTPLLFLVMMIGHKLLSLWARSFVFPFPFFLFPLQMSGPAACTSQTAGINDLNVGIMLNVKVTNRIIPLICTVTFRSLELQSLICYIYIVNVCYRARARVINLKFTYLYYLK